MRTQLTILFLLISILFPQFDWIDGGAPIRQGEHIEWMRTGDIGNVGEVILGWSDTRQSFRDIYLQKYNIDGQPLWQENGLVAAKVYGSRQEDPITITDGNGGVFLIWADYREESDVEGDIYGQHILSDGSLVWPVEGQSIAVKPGGQKSLNMCSDGEGGVYIIWKDFGESMIYGTHISSEDEILEPGEGIPLMSSSTHESSVSLETAGNGEAGMVWSDDRDGDQNIYGQRIRANHDEGTISTLWSTFEEGGKVICDASGNQENPKITYAHGCCGDQLGITVVVWQDFRNESKDIYMQYLYSDGLSFFENNGLEVCGVTGDQTKPRVKADASGAYVVWYDDRNNNDDIYAQKILMSADDPIQWEDGGRSVCSFNQVQSQVRLSVDGEGGIYFVWMDDRPGGSETDIYLQHIDANNQQTYAEDGLPISTAQLKGYNPLVKNDGNGGAFVIWEDKRDGSGGVYIQHLDISNGITLEENGILVYYGMDGPTNNAGSEFIDNNKLLIYWEDHERGNLGTFNYAKIIDSNYGISYDNAYNAQFSIMSTNPSQVLPEVKLIGENLFMGFLQDNYIAGQDPGEGFSQYFVILDSELNNLGNPNGTWLNPSDSFDYSWTGDSQLDLDLVENDGYIFYFTSLSPFWAGVDVYVRKVDQNGSILWLDPINLTNAPAYDNYVRVAFSNNENGGAIFGYDQSDNYIYLSSIDSDGNILEGFPQRVCNIDSEQFIKGGVKTEEGIFIYWEDNRSGDADIYGQYFTFNGEPLGPEEGLPISIYQNDQKSPAITYNDYLDEILVCWEGYNGTDYDIFCNTIDMTTLTVITQDDGSPLYVLAEGEGGQQNAFIYSALNGHYMCTWDDERQSTDLEGDDQFHTDIYYQEISNGSFVYEQNGMVVCDAYHAQWNPKIALYSSSDVEDSYLLYWIDQRSTGKEYLFNLYAQSITHGSLDNLSEDLVMDFSLDAIYPNPFNPIVNVRISVPSHQYVSINIYDITGSLVTTIYDGNLVQGQYEYNWDANQYSSGLYFINLISDDKSITSKMTLIK